MDYEHAVVSLVAIVQAFTAVIALNLWADLRRERDAQRRETAARLGAAVSASDWSRRHKRPAPRFVMPDDEWPLFHDSL